MDKNNSIRFDAGKVPTKEMQDALRRIDRREWWLWPSVVLVVFLLVVGIVFFSLTGLMSPVTYSYSISATRAVSGLAALVFLFLGHALYQQIQINRIHRQLMEQIFAMDKVKDLAQEVYTQAILDSLTGAFNRRYAEKRLSEEMAKSERCGLPLTIILFDLDDFKQVNDKYGHAAGDCLLKAFAERLGKSTRGSDVAARFGGDEFAVILPDCSPDDVQYILKRLDGLRVNLGNDLFPVSYSAGWTNYISGESPTELLKRADENLYANKRSSKVPV